MLSTTRSQLGVGGILLLAAAASAGARGADSLAADGRHAMIQLDGTTAQVAMYERDGRIERIYGNAFSNGATPEASAEAFLDANAGLIGIDQDDLAPTGPFADGRHLQPLMYDAATGTYKFTALYYTQIRDGLPVFDSRLVMLVRNEPGNPLVLVNPDVRNLGNFQVDRAKVGQPMPAVNQAALDLVQAKSPLAGNPFLISSRRVIWAGVAGDVAAPTVADEFVIGLDVDKWLVLTDSATGAVLHDRQLVVFEDIVGNASGLATEGVGAEQCEDEVPMGMQYARVNAGPDVAFTDVNGDFVIPHGGSGVVTVTAQLKGQWFDVFNAQGADLTLSQSVTPPGPVNFLFNASNTEFERAQVNGYRYSNEVRDWVLMFNPTYPTLGSGGFPVTVNRTDGFCPGNAWYDPGGPSINFCRTGGGYPNTAWTSVIHHEYGHHLVEAGGSGQGAYGEGMGDVMSVLLLDSPLLGLGFFGSCGDSLRTADNTIQYPCSGAIHFCGQLISGCVWDTRNMLTVTEPATYRDIISNLAINSILVHSGSSITPSITVDYLVLDDDNETIFDGTPHYNEIATGFGLHNMDAPELALLAFEFPDGRPPLVSPAGGTALRVVVVPVAATPEPGSGRMFVNDGVSGWQMLSMNEVEPNVYDAIFPETECGRQIAYYFDAQTTGGQTQVWPPDAPTVSFDTIAATGSQIVFADDFNDDLGWTVSGVTVGDGPWERDIPITVCNRGNPLADADGSEWCYLTDNAAPADCNTDVDGGTTILTSPIMDASGGSPYIAYYRWYSNTVGADPENDIFEVEVSANGGSTWVDLETVGPSGPEVDGGWFYKEYRLEDVISPTSQFRIRFKASDLSSGSVIEAAVDGVELKWYLCDEQFIPEDVNEDGVVDILDLLAVLSAWGPCEDCPEDVNEDGVVDILDLLAVLAAWTG